MKNMRNSLVGLAVMAGLSLLMGGCVETVVDFDDGWNDWDHSGQHEASATFAKTLSVGSRSAIQVVGRNGKVEIRGVPGATSITIDAVRRVRSDSQADAANYLDHLWVAVDWQPDEVVVKTIQPDYTHGRTYVVDYEITVPAYFLARVTNGNGTVRIEGLEADIHVENGNGDVKLVDVVGSSWVTVGNGEISTWAFLPDHGKIVNALGNGSVFLEVQSQVSASFGAKVGNGSISLSGLELLEMVSTKRQLKGVLGGGDGFIDLSVGNGQIRVRGE
jgi:hypothetical protein